MSNIHELPADPVPSVPSGVAELPADVPSHSFWSLATNSTLSSSVLLTDDGRIDIDADSKLVRTLSRVYANFEKIPSTPPPEYSQILPDKTLFNIKLNIVIQVVGSRGDIQPFVALGNELKRYGHRVRLATHNIFDQFVRNSGLEFYPIGGDPAELMAYMVKNPGLIPSMRSLRAGEIHRKRVMVREMLDGCWSSCIEPDIFTGDPFVADAIIANPPSFAHVHCAQALGIPLQLMFTMPWTATDAFPHPLANLKNLDEDLGILNYVSYGVVNWMTWQGLGDVINKWRDELDLEEVALTEGPGLLETLKIPTTYCWSPGLIPKPADWPSHIDVCGFFFRDPPHYEPSPSLDAFLKAGPPPVYIGFGSIVLEDPEKMTAIILQAVEAAGVRAIISKGWSGLGGSTNTNVYFVGDCPHEWLFQHVTAVVHHGGAGTTACGLRYGKPTAIVPFFGDQLFWGTMVAARQAGPSPIPHKELTASNLAEAIRYCLTPDAARGAGLIADKMRSEMGVQEAVKSFHRNLPLERLQCEILPDQPAVWSFSKGKRTVRLSKVAASTLLAKKTIERSHIELYKSNPIFIETRRWDPVTGGSSALLGTVADLTTSLTGTFYKPILEFQTHREQQAHIAGSESTDPIPSSASNSALAANDVASEKGSINEDRSRKCPANFRSASSYPSSSKKQGSLAGKMVASSAKSIGSFAPTALKGMTVDIPLAMTEGLRNFPRSYGEKVRDHGNVSSWKSGAVVAGKTFAWGMADGISDVVVKPYQGARKEGAKGAVKGLGKGVLNLGAKTGAAMFGLMVYPSAGIAKSLRSAIHTKTRKTIVEARYREGQWLTERSEAELDDFDAIVDTFEMLRARQK